MVQIGIDRCEQGRVESKAGIWIPALYTVQDLTPKTPKPLTRLAGTPQAVTEQFTYTADWNQVKTYTDPLSHSTTFGYNERGALTSITNHLGHLTQIAYNGAGQPLTLTTTFTYKQGLLRSVKDHLNRTTTYWNDVLGRITQITDPLGNQTLVEYDVMDRVKKLTDPLKGLTQFT